MRKVLKIYLIAGEPSGDLIGERLMHDLSVYSSSISFLGIGGDRMGYAGLRSLFPITDLAVMGFIEVLPSLPKIMGRIKQTVEHILRVKPDIVITIDSPSFCFRVAKKIKEQSNIKLVHFVAPSVWAYNPGRAKKIASIYDHLFTLLPFEPPYFEQEGLPTTFIGHTMLQTPLGNGASFRRRYSLELEQPLLYLSPGSRKGEIKRLLPIFLEAVHIISKKLKKLVVVIPTFSHFAHLIEKQIKECKFAKFIIVDNQEYKKNAIAAAHVALTKSGTVTTEIAMHGIPMVVAHKLNALTFLFLRRIIKVKYATLINILADQEVVPELIQENCKPEKIAEAVLKLFQDTNLAKKQIKSSQMALLKMKEKEPATVIAARKIWEIIS